MSIWDGVVLCNELEVYADDLARVEELASLTTAIILTSADDLLARAHPTYRSDPFTATHRFEYLHFLEGTPGQTDTHHTLQLTFRVTGHLQLVKEEPTSFGLIEAIHSPGKAPHEGVEIDVGVK